MVKQPWVEVTITLWEPRRHFTPKKKIRWWIHAEEQISWKSNPNPRQTLHRLSDNLFFVFLCERLYLHALSIFVESCGCGHLALLTAGSCCCCSVHMVVSGKFLGYVFCRVSCFNHLFLLYPASSKTVIWYLHVRKILSRQTRLYVFISSVNPAFNFSTVFCFF